MTRAGKGRGSVNGFQNNSECILAYLDFFHLLSTERSNSEIAQAVWEEILERETATPEEVRLAPRFLRDRFDLNTRQFLLAMAALALEVDCSLRSLFRDRYGLALPTVEYGLKLTEPVCPTAVDTLAELTGPNMLCGLVLTTSQSVTYPMERPLILCRTLLAFLTGLTFADIQGCTPLLSEDRAWLPLYEEALAQIQSWYVGGADTPLYLRAPTGAGRRTLLCRACGGAACVDMAELEDLSALDQDHIFREAMVMAMLLSVPVCAHLPSERSSLRKLERLCGQFCVPLAVLAEEDVMLTNAREVIRLPPCLTTAQREAAWRSALPNADGDAAPTGAMTIGAVAETARLALRFAAQGGRGSVTRADVDWAMRQRGGATEFGVRYDISVTLDDMVLPENVREQLELICCAAQYGAKLEEWGISRRHEGVTAVFHGPSGTGKTMAAEAIAGKLGWPLLRADLSQLMDKYVGETEKHLARLLQSARENRCVLLFDEADALFGKRSSVSTGQDKYANISTSYLLQEIERYEGVALLSTNLLSNFDDAFLRRLHYIVRFSLPDAGLRRQLWRRTLPKERLEGEIPYDLLAQSELSPARIAETVRVAAVAALSRGRERLDAGMVTEALRLELEKGGKNLPKALSDLAEKTRGDGYDGTKDLTALGEKSGCRAELDRYPHTDEAGF